jgi:hypothetical protein
MEDMWDIKRVLESQGKEHTKVDIQSNLELQSRTHMTSDLSVLHIHGNLRR